ncbi:tripartite tricarboxylate transporter substrate binding protein [Desulfovibrio sp. OttesenSCG-928-O18]|nr:tripartite tricarboxylate transporter substrate binding protein [Desulfovibrio sp. OttesenSCG-928-O18]
MNMSLLSIRKTFVCLLCALSLIAVAGKDLQAAGADNYPSKPITVVISWAAGSSGDNGARILLPYVAKALGGANFTVINKPGASGWLGWDEVAKAKPDGYTISLLTLPSFYSGYMDPQNKRTTNLSNFQMIANQVSDWGVLYAQGGEKRWKDMKGMLEYAKTHELVVGASGVGSDDNMLLSRLKRQHPEAKLTALQGTSSGNVLPMLLGKHIDMQMANLGDAAPKVKSGELTALCLFAPERSPILPDLPTYKELGLGDIIGSSDRGYIMPAGVDPAILAKLEKAFETGIKDKEHIEKMMKLGINVYYMDSKQLTEHAKAGEKVVESLLDVLGWKK